MELSGVSKEGEFKIKNIEFIDESDLTIIPTTNLKYNGIEILIDSNEEESLKHIQKDYEILVNNDIEQLIKMNFIPWLKGEDFENLDDEKIYEGLKLTRISYHYQQIVGEYSPTKKDDFFGEFEFDFESGNDYTENLLQACAFVLLINNGKIYNGRNYDI